MDNLNNKHLTEEQMTAVREALVNLENTLKLLDINLTPEQRNRYGRVNEQNKLFINKTRDFATAQPDLRTADVDWEEFEKDFKSRSFLENTISRLKSLTDRCVNAKTLHDFDNYQDALADYAYTQYKAKSKAVGYEEKYNEQKQFFKRNRNTTANTNHQNPPTEDL